MLLPTTAPIAIAVLAISAMVAAGPTKAPGCPAGSCTYGHTSCAVDGDCPYVSTCRNEVCCISVWSGFCPVEKKPVEQKAME